MSADDAERHDDRAFGPIAGALHTLSRGTLKLTAQLMPIGAAETIVSELGERGQHNSKMFTFDGKGNLYVEVGSPSNALGKPDRAPNAEGSSEAEIREIFDILKERTIGFDTQTWNRRYRGFMDKIKTGSIYDVAEVLRDLYRLKANKALSFGERRMLDTARSLIVKEIAIAREQTEDQVREEIEAIFFSN